MSSSDVGIESQSDSAQANRGNRQRLHTNVRHSSMLAQYVDTGPELLLHTWRFVQVCSFVLINQIVKEPYMDEKFHVPQAILYCNDKFSTYDSKLTTPPGIYLLSYLLHQIGVPCNITYLRSLNLFIGTFLLPRVCTSIYRTLHPSSSRSEIRWSGSLAAMPILSFFSLLYYTDLASTYTLLLSYDMLLTNHLWTASLVAFISLWFRQTNVVWITAFFGLTLLRRLEFQDQDPISRRDCLVVETDMLSIYHSIVTACKRAMNNLPLVFQTLGPFFPIAAFSIWYLYWNGSIVLGDKSMHQAGFYPIQLFYMSSFIVSMSIAPLLVRIYEGQITRLIRAPKTVLCLFMLAMVAAMQRDVQHPFLLADNRHYSFYLNKRLLQPIPKLALGLAFTMTSALCYIGLTDTLSLTVLILAGASAITLCPTSLLEFRYYIVPFMLWRLHTGHRNTAEWLLTLELVSWIIINLLCVYGFLYHGFHWNDSTEIQRFMW